MSTGKESNEMRLFIHTVAGRNYFPMYRPLFFMLRKTEALFMAELLNVASMNLPKDDVWFKCTDKYLKKLSDWSKHDIQTSFAGLRSKGLVETKVVGLRRRRMVKINIEKLKEMLEDYMKKKEASKRKD